MTIGVRGSEGKILPSVRQAGARGLEAWRRCSLHGSSRFGGYAWGDLSRDTVLPNGRDRPERSETNLGLWWSDAPGYVAWAHPPPRGTIRDQAGVVVCSRPTWEPG